jgi:hypothetical protein
MQSVLGILGHEAVTLWASVMLITLCFLIARVAHASQRVALMIALLVALTPAAMLPNLA